MATATKPVDTTPAPVDNPKADDTKPSYNQNDGSFK